MKKSVPVLALAGFLATQALGCALDPSSDSGDEEVKATAVCSKQHSGKSADGDTVTICDKTYTTLPFVRPPADKVPTTGSATLYVGVSDMMEGGHFVTRDGEAYTLVDDNDKVVSMSAGTSNAILKSIHMPSNRNMYMLYKVTGELGTGKDQYGSDIKTIRATSAKPVILINGQAIDLAQTFGAWEGTVAARKTDSTFDPKKRVKVRIRFTSVSSSSSEFAEWSSSKHLPDGDSYQVQGVVENLSAAVKADDGSCMPALSALGAQSPFAGATSGAVALQRIAGMHFSGDDEHVLTMPANATGWSLTAMGSFGRFLPSDFISTKPGSGVMTPHGTPSGAGIELSAVTGGGGGC